jgi:hypothetical protein
MGVLKQITKCFHYRDKNTFFKALQHVCPHIEFTPPAWSPWQTQDIATIEEGQEKGLRIITGLRGDSYEERCREAGQETLEAREKKIQDITQAFKILKGIPVDKMDPEKLYPA